MRILVSKDGYVDFEDPIDVAEWQKDKFIKFFKTLFPNNFKTIDIAEKEKYVGERESHQKAWTPKERGLLLGPEDNETLADRMDRSVMSVSMQRGHFVPAFMVWLKKKGYALTQDENMIKQFLKEQGEHK